MVNEARFQYGRDFEYQTANGAGPSLSITNGINLGMPNFLPRPAYPDEKQFQWLDNLSFTRGRHNLKVGADIRYVRDSLINLYSGGGVYSYANLNSWALDCSTPNYPFDCTASAGSGTPGKRYTTFTQAFDTQGLGGALQLNTMDYGFYLQDNWKPWSSLTVNLGMRYEQQTIPQPQSATPVDARTGRINVDTNNFGPRIGLSWDPFKDSKTILRAGYGMFYGRTQNSTLANLLLNNGQRLLTFSFTPSTAGSPVFPNVFRSLPTGVAGIPDIAVAAPDFASPLIHQFELGIEREIMPHMSLTVSYLASRGLRLPYFQETNLFPPTDTVTLTVNCAAFPSNAVCANAPASVTVPFFRGPSSNRPNPAVRHDIVASSVVNTWYNGLVVQVKRSFNRGFLMQASFTWSKAQDNGQTSTTFTASNGLSLNPFDNRLEYALSNFDQRKRFVMNALYEPPFRNITNGTLRTILDGFKFSGILTLGDGRPITAGTSGSVSIPGTGTSYISGVDSGPLGDGGMYRAPWLARNTFLSPGLVNVDFRVAREFAIKERYRLQFTVEAFNLFNHTNVSGVNATAFTFGATPGTTAYTTLTPRNDFLLPTGTSSTNYRERQVQLAFRLTF